SLFTIHIHTRHLLDALPISSRGLGFVIQSAQALIDTPTMFASLLVIAALGLSLFGVIALVERLVVNESRLESPGPWGTAPSPGASVRGCCVTASAARPTRRLCW